MSSTATQGELFSRAKVQCFGAGCRRASFSLFAPSLLRPCQPKKISLSQQHPDNDALLFDPPLHCAGLTARTPRTPPPAAAAPAAQTAQTALPPRREGQGQLQRRQHQQQQEQQRTRATRSSPGPSPQRSSALGSAPVWHRTWLAALSSGRWSRPCWPSASFASAASRGGVHAPP
jgi:hypothetical protein